MTDIVKEFMKAYIELDRGWFLREANKLKCRLLASALNKQYNKTKDKRYLECMTKICKIKSAAKRDRLWKEYIAKREKEGERHEQTKQSI